MATNASATETSRNWSVQDRDSPQVSVNRRGHVYFSSFPPSPTTPPLLETKMPGHLGTHLSGHGVELVKGGQHEHRGLTHPRLSLAHDVHAKDGLEEQRNTNKKKKTRREFMSTFGEVATAA